MIRSIIILIAICCSGFGIGQDLKSTVTLIQGKNRYSLGFTDTTLVLKPETFKFEFEIINSEGIFVAASPNNEYYNTPKDSVWNNWEYTQDMVAAEEDFNADKDLIVGHESFKYWFYSPEKQDWHRFDEGPKLIGTTIYASYTVDNIFDLNSGEYVALNKWKDSIYLLFFQTVLDDNRQVVFPQEKKRVTIIFRD